VQNFGTLFNAFLSFGGGASRRLCLSYQGSRLRA
jgi:hypothetical protein